MADFRTLHCCNVGLRRIEFGEFGESSKCDSDRQPADKLLGNCPPRKIFRSFCFVALRRKLSFWLIFGGQMSQPLQGHLNVDPRLDGLLRVPSRRDIFRQEQKLQTQLVATYHLSRSALMLVHAAGTGASAGAAAVSESDMSVGAAAALVSRVRVLSSKRL